MKDKGKVYEYKVVCLNVETNQMFEVGKDTYSLRLFKNKCFFSKKIKILGVVKNY